MAEAYVCSLDEATLKKAREELNEDPRERLGAVDTLRDWVNSQKYLHCPTDTAFLLPFLRARKFSQLEARKQLTNFLTRRSRLPHMFQDFDPLDPGINAVLDAGVILVLPGRDKEGRKVLMTRPGIADVEWKRYSKESLFRSFAMVLDTLYFLDEPTQVHGTIMLVDFSHGTTKFIRAVTLQERKDFFQTWEKGYPARIKGVHLYNIGVIMDFLLTIIKLIMSEKLQKRIVQHGENLESVYKVVPLEMLPEDYLPDDYEGPSGGTIQQITENMKAYFTRPEVAERIRYISSSQHGVDKTLMPEDVPQESFRKLNIE